MSDYSAQYYVEHASSEVERLARELVAELDQCPAISDELHEEEQRLLRELQLALAQLDLARAKDK